jgi:GntR family transcriptional regulator
LSTLTEIRKDIPIPLYYQLKEWILAQIDGGALVEGDQIASEQALSSRFELSRGTVRQALNELVAEGWLYRARGLGTFVGSPKVEYGLAQRLTSLAEDMRERSQPFTSELLARTVEPASNAIAARLHLAPSVDVIHLERVGRVPDEPVVVATTYLPFAPCAGVMEEDLTNCSLYEILEQHCGQRLARATRTLEMAEATAHEAAILGIPIGAPVHLMRTVAYLDNGTPVEYSKLRFCARRTRFVFQVRRL